ncbi:MAG: hypothetical protein ACK5AZ_25585 [Bryobacteraceae bacterium]
MPGGVSIYLANQLLDHVLGNTSFAPTVYIGLFTALPSDGGIGGVEASTGGYARVSKANDPTNWPAAEDGIKRNATPINWPAFSANMPQFVGAGVWDAPSGGYLLYFGPFSTPRTVLENEPFEIPALGGTFRGV